MNVCNNTLSALHGFRHPILYAKTLKLSKEGIKFVQGYYSMIMVILKFVKEKWKFQVTSKILSLRFWSESGINLENCFYFLLLVFFIWLKFSDDVQAFDFGRRLEYMRRQMAFFSWMPLPQHWPQKNINSNITYGKDYFVG